MNEIDSKQWKEFAKNGLPSFFAVLLFKIMEGNGIQPRNALPLAVLLPLLVFHFVPPRSPFGIALVIRFLLIGVLAYFGGFLFEKY